MSDVTASPEQRLRSLIDDEVTRRALHSSVQKFYMYTNASFISDRVRREFLERLLKLNHLSHFEPYDVAKLGDFHRLIYRSNVSNTLLYLNLRKFIPGSRAAKCFARYVCFCKLRDLILDVGFGGSSGNSEYLVSNVLSTCIKVKKLKFYNFSGSGIEPFALETRSRRFGQSKTSSPSTLRVMTKGNRTSVKYLMAKALQLKISETVVFTWSCTQKLNRVLKNAEKEYWHYIIAQ